jgi:hypothetical protein
MSGRSGYRKTDRKRNRFAKPAPKSNHVLRFMLPKVLAFALSPGEHGFGVTIGFNDIAFVTGESPSHCCQLAADFLDKAGIRQWPQKLEASIVKLLPCPAHCPPIHRAGFKPLTADVEAIHDNVSRNGLNRRACSIEIGRDAITFAGAASRRLVHEFADC